MKQIYKSKKLHRLSFLVVALFSVVSVMNSCKEDDEDEFQDYLVQFEVKAVKGTGSGDPVLKTIVTQVGVSQNTTFNPPGITWKSDEFFVNSSQSQLNLDANALLPNADSKLIVTLYVDGVVAKSDTAMGSGTKDASIDYSFLEL
ncbi:MULTISPECIES: hypothetical protein [Chryseobacterium]|uniref:DUF4843 domain-containing protein n=2 Tax=Chryseobacterium aquaticum TaxID=452084 RepID=A0A101CF43_9FLAO|nr:MULTISPECIES: hypothetical protein [Chryseobacterium]KUJ55116.1 hypothetical protein AR686_16355 [Chryseobacterium aquaticum subsp. greenlandense]NMR34451.1 hypothetical protein [Chryseobacterium aquaticum]NRQ46565.1 hypothetical protein [Chryseobacterium sp. C-204]